MSDSISHPESSTTPITVGSEVKTPTLVDFKNTEELLAENQRLIAENNELKSRLTEVQEASNYDSFFFDHPDLVDRVLNHKGFNQYAEMELQRSIRNKTPLTIIAGDGDYFKDFNDTQGHIAGDRLIIELFRVLNGCIRSIDLLARLGGDEFVILLSATQEEALLVAERIKASVPKKAAEVFQKSITVSIGIYEAKGDEKTLTSIRGYADLAMYEAKQKRDAIFAFSHEPKPSVFEKTID